MKLVDLTPHIGRTAGLWTVVGISHKTKRQFLHCRCRCGNECDVRLRALDLGISRGCRDCTRSRIGRPTPAELRFWMNVKSSRDSCWLWCASVNSAGYGKFKASRDSVFVHRFSWELHYGEIPEGLFVCHKCDNRICVRPDHLFLGTHQDNMDDMVRKGRAVYSPLSAANRAPVCGERNGQSVLTDAIVKEIRALARAGVAQKEITRMYSLASGHVCMIVNGKIWKHVT